MTYQRLAYDDPSSATEMTLDCQAVEAALHLPEKGTAAERAVRAATKPAPSLRFEDLPRETSKPTIEVSETAARLAAAMQLHLD